MTHIEKADKFFEKKFHCSQAVFVAFSEELGLTEEQALKIGACFGSGMSVILCNALENVLLPLPGQPITMTFFIPTYLQILILSTVRLIGI